MLEKVLLPVTEEFTGLVGMMKTAAPTEVFERYVDTYLALYAVGRIGEVLFDRLTETLSEADRAAVAAACREVVDGEIDRFAQIIVSGDTGGVG